MSDKDVKISLSKLLPLPSSSFNLVTGSASRIGMRFPPPPPQKNSARCLLKHFSYLCKCNEWCLTRALVCQLEYSHKGSTLPRWKPPGWLRGMRCRGQERNKTSRSERKTVDKGLGERGEVAVVWGGGLVLHSLRYLAKRQMKRTSQKHDLLIVAVYLSLRLQAQ